MQQVNTVSNSLLEVRTLPSDAQHADLHQYVQDGLLTVEEQHRIANGLQVHQPYMPSKPQFRSPAHAG